tara:strand:- start:1529 stop:2044 length:516 start_codon:yes stop_codon:yes gene_type:complete
MLTLYLLRHAKSNWNSFDGNDFNRDINEIGIKRTEAIGNYIHERKLDINEILLSPSLRTKRTSEIIFKYLEPIPSFKYIDELYYSSSLGIYEITKMFAQKKKVMIISHEPKLSQSIHDFSADYKNNFFQKSQEKFPTSGLFYLEFNTDNWNDISRFNSKIMGFVTPNDINY